MAGRYRCRCNKKTISSLFGCQRRRRDRCSRAEDVRTVALVVHADRHLFRLVAQVVGVAELCTIELATGDRESEGERAHDVDGQTADGREEDLEVGAGHELWVRSSALLVQRTTQVAFGCK